MSLGQLSTKWAADKASWVTLAIFKDWLNSSNRIMASEDDICDREDAEMLHEKRPKK